MNSRTDLETVIPGSGQYSLKKDLRLSAWVLVAAVAYIAASYLLRHRPDGGVAWHMIVLLPLIPFGLWVRDVIRFTRGLDELQRNLQLKVWLFAALGTVVAETTVNVLSANGLDLEPVGIVGALAWMVVLWAVGNIVVVRRYR